MAEYSLKFDGSKKEAQKLGAFFTPLSLGERMADKFSSSPKGKTVIDPSCGYGNLLLVMLDRKIKDGEDAVSALSEIYGIEFDPRNHEICLRNLRQWADEHKAVWNEDQMRSHIVVGDALVDSSYEFPDKVWNMNIHGDVGKNSDGKAYLEIVKESVVVKTIIADTRESAATLKATVTKLKEKKIPVRKFLRSV